MANHTPGPWKWNEYYECLFNEAGEYIFESFPYEGMDLAYTNSREANAKLIAAAPDLLEALESLLAAVETMRCPQNVDDVAMLVIRFAAPIQHAQKAIKKAKGGQ
jgi:hypothetical protein